MKIVDIIGLSILEQKYNEIRHECIAGTVCTLGGVTTEIYVTPTGKFAVVLYNDKVINISQCDFMEHQHSELHERIVDDFNKKARL